MRKKIKITPLPVAAFTPEAAQDMADSISAIAKGMQSVFKSRLTKKAIITLVASSSRVSKENVEAVLTHLEDFEGIWLNKKESKK